MPKHLSLCARCRRGWPLTTTCAVSARHDSSSGGLLLLQMVGPVVLTTAVAARACQCAVEELRRCPRRVLQHARGVPANPALCGSCSADFATTKGCGMDNGMRSKASASITKLLRQPDTFVGSRRVVAFQRALFQRTFQSAKQYANNVSKQVPICVIS